MPGLPDPRQVVEQTLARAQAALDGLRHDVDSAQHGGTRSDGTPWNCAPEALQLAAEAIAMAEPLLSLIRSWLPYFEICFPVPPKKGAPPPRRPPELEFICSFSVPILILCADLLVGIVASLAQLLTCGCGGSGSADAARQAGHLLGEVERQLQALRPHLPSIE